MATTISHPKHKKVAWLSYQLKSLAKSTSHKQIESAIASIRESVSRLKIESCLSANLPITQPVFDNALAAINQSLDEAKYAVNCWEIQQGWSHYYEAELLAYHLMCEKDWKARVKSIFNDAEVVLDECEKKTVRDLIGKAGQGGVWVVQGDANLEKPTVIDARRVV